MSLMDLINGDDSAWQDQAGCRSTVYPDLFVPEGHGSKNSIAAAKDYCSDCPVVVECLTSGIDTDSEGVWGGVYFEPRVADRRKTQLKIINEFELPINSNIKKKILSASD